MSRIERAFVAVAVLFIRIYQKTLSPLLGPNCRFHPTCSQYAIEAFEKHGFVKGIFLAVRRLVLCGPWHPGGIDNVPDEVRLGKMFRGR